MLKKALISIVIPTYNRTKFLEEAIHSVFSQTYKNFEILLINDGSQSTYRKAIEDILSSLPRKETIRLFHNQNNRGIAFCRNLGVMEAKGDFITFLDDDDSLHPNFLQEMTAALQNNPNKSAAMCLGRLVSTDTRNPGMPYFIKRQIMEHTNYHSGLIETDPSKFSLIFAPLVNSFIYRREVLLDNMVPNLLCICGNDTYLWISLHKKNHSFQLVNQVLCSYRMHNTNVHLAKDRPQRRLVFFSEVSKILTTPIEQYLVAKGRKAAQVETGAKSRISYLTTSLRKPLLFFWILKYQFKIKIQARMAYILTKVTDQS